MDTFTEQAPVASALGSTTGQVKKFWKFLIFLAILGGLFGAHPYIVARVAAGDTWQGVVPELTGDSLHYMTRANAAIHGGMIGNNPYYLLSYKSPSPSFSFADTVTGIPHAFLSPFEAAVWNAFFWNALFALLIGGLLLWLRYSRSMIAISFFIVASGVFWYLLRTTNMQVVFPFFLLFFILLLRVWHRDRLQIAVGRSPLFLGLFTGLAPYLHTFLFQVTTASLFVGIVLAFILRRMQLVRSLSISIAIMIALVIPYLFYFHGIKDFPSFAETINYFMGVRSHFPSPLVYFYGRWLALLFVWSFLLWLVGRREDKKGILVLKESTLGPTVEDVVLTMATASLAVLGVMMGNIITGVDIAGPSHASYFGNILLPLGLVLLAWPTVRALSARGVYVQKFLIILCALVVLIKVFVTIPGQFPPAAVYRPDSVRPAGNPQYIMPALTAIRSLPSGQVVTAPISLNAYIPLYTGQHVLYDSNGESFGAGMIESTDRLFASKLGQHMTEEDVSRAISNSIVGADSEIFSRNKAARKSCAAVFRLSSCETLIVARLFTGDGVINRSLWFNYYQTAVRPNFVKYLRRFNVSQVVIDRQFPTPEFLREQTPWYSDQYYAIYDITRLR